MKKKKSLSYHRRICTLSGCCLLLPPAAATLRAGMFPGADVLSAALLCSGAVLLLLPLSEEASTGSFRFGLAAAALCLAASLALPPRLWPLPVLALHAGYLAYRSVDLYSELWALFKPVKVWTQLETQARDGYSLLLYLLAASFPGASAPAPLHGIYLPFCLGLHGVLLARVLTGRTLFLPRRRELELKELIKGNLRSTPVVNAERTEDMGRMKRLYERVIALMEQKRPFLDEEFSLDDLAGAVFSNRAYLSKTINILSGRNFSQFVNCFRIRYSVELLRKDPTLRLIDVAMMSGFHTTVTFNMAFKLNMGETPSRFQERLRVERAKARPSRIPEQAP